MELDRLLVVVALLVSLQTLVMWRRPPWGFSIEIDSSFDLQLSSLVLEAGRWGPGMGFGTTKEYSYFPALHIFTTALAETAGLSPVHIAQFLPSILLGPLTVILYYLSMRMLLPGKVAMWASLVFSICPQLVFFEAGYRREIFALAVYSIYLFTIICIYTGRTGGRGFFLVGVVGAFAVSTAHHWTAYNLLLIPIVLFGLARVYVRVVNFFRHDLPSHIRVASLRLIEITYILVFSWIAFVSFIILTSQAKMGFDALALILSPHELYSPTLAPYTFQERMMIYWGLLVLAVLGTYELLISMFRKRKSSKEFILESWFIFSSVYIALFTFLVPKEMGFMVVTQRSWVFAFFGLSPLIAKNLAEKYKSSSRLNLRSNVFRQKISQYKPLLLIFPLISAVLMSQPHVHNPSFILPSDSYYSAALWIRNYAEPKTDITVGSEFARLVLIPYGRVDSFRTSLDDFLQRLANQPTNLTYVFAERRIIVWDKQVHTEYLDDLRSVANISFFEAYCNRIYDSPSSLVYLNEGF